VDLDPLLSVFPPDGPPPTGATDTGLSGATDTGLPGDIAPIVSALGGVSLAGGLYRVFTASEIAEWTGTARRAFPQFGERVTVFAADWLGRLFATDAARRDSRGLPMVLLLEPGTDEALELPVTVEGLHTTELLEASDAALAASFYDDWRSDSGDAQPLTRGECVGYQVPLFLGGTDTTRNLQRTDMSVYWALAAQLREQSLGLSQGTPVAAVIMQTPKRGLFRRQR